MNGGRFDFDDGGTYCGGWEDGKAHGHGVCTGPKGQGEYSGAWHYGFEVSGVYTWPSGNCYEGQWQNGKRHGLGAERRGRWVYRGEWTQGYKGRYGIRQSTNSQAKYEGTWANGLQDGYGTETYADGGTYQGQWLRGMRHGYGARRSAQYSVAAKYRSYSHAHASLNSLRSSDQCVDENVTHDGKEKKADESRGGFVLRARSDPSSRRRSLSEKSGAVKRTILQGLRIKKQRSAGDINQKGTSGTGETPKSLRSSGSTGSCASDESAVTGYSGHDHGTFVEEFVDPNATELYMGEWKNDRRSGFGVSERSDGLKYEGEWFNNKKFGYGVTTFKDGSKEEGKYKNNVLITSRRKKNMLFVRSSKLRERIDSAVSAANRAAQLATQKGDIAVSRSANARERADQADLAVSQAIEDSEIARLCAKQFAPDFEQPGTEFIKQRQSSGQLGNHIGLPKVGRPALSLRIPKHMGLNFFGSTPASETTSQQVTATTSSILTPPMFTPPEEQPVPGDSSRQRQRQQLTKQLTFDEQSASASNVGAFQNEASGISTVQDAPELDTRFAKSSEVRHFATLSQVTVRQHGLDSSEYISSRPRQELQMSVSPRRVDVPCDYPLPPSTSTAPLEASKQTRLTAIRTQHYSSAERDSSEDGSRNSLNQVTYDHFDQYSMAANPAAIKSARVDITRQQQQSGFSPVTASPLEDTASSSLIRRTTLASSRDLKGVPPQAIGSKLISQAPLAAFSEFEPEIVDESVLLSSQPRGSMPDIAKLEQVPLYMPREEAARLSSQRRQELQRMQEETQLLKTNPLRYLQYIYHPSVRDWIIRWKLPLLILLVNFGLSLIFYRLLTYSKDHNDGRR